MKILRTLPVAIALTLTLAARGDAPVGQYLTFSPTSLNITDAHTNLVWLRTPVATNVQTPSSPSAYAIALMLCTNAGVGWRLPSVRELLSIVDEQPHSEHVAGQDVEIFIDANAFPGTPNMRFLAASPDPSNRIWWVDFGTGVSGESKDAATYAVRCVK